MSRHHDDHKAIPWRVWARVRRLVLTRDRWRCRACGHPGDLEVHHVVRLADGGAPLALDNLRTLCRSCHLSAHLSRARREWRELLNEGA